MTSKKEPVFDADNPEWTEADFAKARPAAEVLPPEFMAAWKRTRGKQKTPTKEQVTLRLSPEVVSRFRATGKGWQARIDEALKRHLGV
jgi:uncharacterized protein (DUF4415 family)